MSRLMNITDSVELDALETIQKGVQKLIDVLDGRSAAMTTKTHIEVYTKIYNMCTRIKPKSSSGYGGQEVYDQYKLAFQDYLSGTVLPALREKHGVYLLMEIDKRLSNHLVMIHSLRHFFYYLDRFYLEREKLPSLWVTGLNIYEELVYKEIHGRVKDVIITLIHQEREGDGNVDRPLLKGAVENFMLIRQGEVDIYQKDLEEPILQETSTYYARMASDHLTVDSFPDYLLMAEQCINKEKDRASSYLHSSTLEKLIEKTQHELLVVHENQLLDKEDSGLHMCLLDANVEELRRMHKLYCKIPGAIDPIMLRFEEHIIDQGTTSVKLVRHAATNKKVDSKDSSGLQELDFVRNVLQLHDKHMNYVHYCFENNHQLHKALKQAFETICNKVINGRPFAEMLASFVDNALRKGGGSEKLSDNEVEETLEKVVYLVIYVHEKDLFSEFCRKKLAYRLLTDRSANDDNERLFLSKLKQYYGGQLTSRMAGMLTDLTVAKENHESLCRYLEDNPSESPGFDMSISVLTLGYWPTYKPSEIILPAEMATGVETFKKYYAWKTQCRKLTWIFSLGTCTLLGRFDARPIELILSTYQAAILLLFNCSERLSVSEIQQQLNLSADDFPRLLHSLSCSKYKILNKEPDTGTISENDIFQFNYSFTDKMRRIKVPLAPLDEKKKVIVDVEKDRRYIVDAAVVRIMKSRKVLGLQELIMECIKQLSHLFKPDVRLIKRRVDDLMERDYLERGESSPNIIKYMA